MFKKMMLFVIALVSVSAITGCNLPFFGSKKDAPVAKVQAKK